MLTLYGCGSIPRTPGEHPINDQPGLCWGVHLPNFWLVELSTHSHIHIPKIHTKRTESNQPWTVKGDQGTRHPKRSRPRPSTSDQGLAPNELI